MNKLSPLYAIPLVAVAALAACKKSEPAAPAAMAGPSAEASVVSAETRLKATDGNEAKGDIKFVSAAGGVKISGTLEGLKPGGVSAFHVHEKGDCSAPDASSAGGHLNPDGKPHGNMTAGDHHAGDMPNITADSEGKAMVDVTVPGLEIGTGSAKDVIGKALVVHAGADDYTSQPAGNAGGRIACGVIEKG
ncbi:superoxide dismutase family protein [Hydrocarboniphaga sp.]|uniref:superoxide dismutase family protein n=1 Tax=Hydrocarboniphaga sp. TaxID=2033016 RepID=UPI003D11DA7C